MLVLCMMICSAHTNASVCWKFRYLPYTDLALAALEQARRNPVVLIDGSPQALPISSETRLHDHRGAERESSGQASPVPPLCHSEARGLPAALRSTAGGGRRLQVLGRHQGSLNPRDRRLAVEVEDHPLDYGDFEGTIPKGEYGGGTVMLWDRGFWTPEDGGNPGQALRKGELKFTLPGEKLKGSWVLVRMRQDRERGRSNRNNWLLIKHRDTYARENGDVVTDEDLSVASGRTLEKIEAGEGPRPKPFMLSGKAAASDAVWHSNSDDKASQASQIPAADRAPKSAKKSAKRSAESKKRTKSEMPQFIAPQLCKPVSRSPVGREWVHEIKLDGYRMQLRVADGQATMRTRKGLDWTSRFS